MANDLESVKQINTVVFFLSGVLLAIVGRPLAMKKVKPNRTYGFRTPKTLSDENIWYAANQTSGRAIVVCGIVTAIAAVLCRGLDFWTYFGVLMTVLLGGLFLSIFVAWFKDIRGK